MIAKSGNSECKVNTIPNMSKSLIYKKNVNCARPFDQIKWQTYKWFERIQTAWYYSREVFAIDKEWHRNKFDIMDTISENIGLASLK